MDRLQNGLSKGPGAATLGNGDLSGSARLTLASHCHKGC